MDENKEVKDGKENINTTGDEKEDARDGKGDMGEDVNERYMYLT